MEPGEYLKLRLKNLEDNKRVLAAFGLMNPFKPVKCIIKKSSRPKPKPVTKKRPLPQDDYDICLSGSLYGTRRKSARLSGQVAADVIGSTYEELDEAERKNTPVPVKRPNEYGSIPDIPVGTEWSYRIDCSRDGVHRPTVAGIHAGPDGAYSIALSGGYEDDVDLGDCFTYTGEGGRDLKGTKANPKNLREAPQTKNQTLERGNLALSRNVETGNPVRVIRGYKLPSQFAPEEGYRYDGIYTVEKYWYTHGLSGFGVWKFALKRCLDQAPSPWLFLQENGITSEVVVKKSTSNGTVNPKTEVNGTEKPEHGDTEKYDVNGTNESEENGKEKPEHDDREKLEVNGTEKAAVDGTEKPEVNGTEKSDYNTEKPQVNGTEKPDNNNTEKPDNNNAEKSDNNNTEKPDNNTEKSDNNNTEKPDNNNTEKSDNNTEKSDNNNTEKSEVNGKENNEFDGAKKKKVNSAEKNRINGIKNNQFKGTEHNAIQDIDKSKLGATEA